LGIGSQPCAYVTSQYLDGYTGQLKLHLKQTLLLGLDTLKKRGIRELELVILGSLKSVVGLGLGNLLNELLEITTISAKLEAVKMEDVGDGVIEEAGIVRDDNCTEAVE
jgi:hypothetical protein